MHRSSLGRFGIGVKKTLVARQEYAVQDLVVFYKLKIKTVF